MNVAVVGGGPIGLASAWRLAQRGLRVTVYDPTPGGGAADVAAGMLAPVSEAHFGEEELLRLNLASAAQWPAFAAELEAASDQRIDYEPVGSLVVAFDNDDHAALVELHRFQVELGLDARRLRSRECRDLEPMLAPTVRSGILAMQDAVVDPRRLCLALLAACERLEVNVVRELVSDLADLDADTVVVAAGCRSAALVDVPVRPVKGQVVTVRAREPLIRHAVRGMVKGASAYLVPRPDGRIVIGATVEEKSFDTTVTAGAVYELMRDATLLVPGVAELELVEVRAGLRPGTPDNVPIVGEVDGVVVATGHYRNGILLTPGTATSVADLVTS